MHVLPDRDIAGACIEFSDDRRHLQLAGVGFDLMEIGIEGIVDAAEDLDGKGRVDAGDIEELFRPEEGEGADGRHRGGPVHQRQTFLVAERERGKPGLGEGRLRVHQLPLQIDLALADDGKRHMGQMDQIARGADAAAFRDEGGDARIDHIPHQFQKLDPDAGVPLHQRVQPDGQDAERDIRQNRLAEARRHG